VTVEFDPVRIGGGRRWPEPGTIVLVVAVLFVGLALLKPWETGRDGSDAHGPAVAEASSAPSVVPPTPNEPPPTSSEPPDRGIAPEFVVTWAHVAAALQSHETWGVQAFVDRRIVEGLARPRGARLFERWEPAAPPQPGIPDGSLPAGNAEETVVMPTSDEPVRVLGITSPVASRPLDARVWWLRPDEPPRWLDVRPVGVAVQDGHLLLLPPRRTDGTASTWPPGRYRFDLLLGTSVTRITVILPSSVARPDPADGGDPFTPGSTVSQGHAGPFQVRTFGAGLSSTDTGAFVVAEGRAIPLDAPGTVPLDEAAAWLDAAAGRPGQARAVAEVGARGVTGIGLRLPTGSEIRHIRLVRLAPAPLTEGANHFVGRFQEAAASLEVALFPAPGGPGATWLPGSYAIEATWLEEGEPRTATWHMTLSPSPRAASGAWTRLVRAWARHAGEWGIVTGMSESTDLPAGFAIRHLSQEPGTVEPSPESLGATCDTGALLDVTRRVFAIAHPPEIALRSVRMERLFVGGRSLAQPVSVAAAAVPGLSVVSAPVVGSWPVGYYRLLLDDGRDERSLVVCLGFTRRVAPHVPLETGSIDAWDGARRQAPGG
jgi:hypothetical protein